MFVVSPTYRVRQGGVVNNTEDNIYTVHNTPLMKHKNEIVDGSSAPLFLYIGTVREGIVRIQQPPLERLILRLKVYC